MKHPRNCWGGGGLMGGNQEGKEEFEKNGSVLKKSGCMHKNRMIMKIEAHS